MTVVPDRSRTDPYLARQVFRVERERSGRAHHDVVDARAACAHRHVAEDVPSLGEPPDDGSRRPFTVQALAGRVLVHEMPYEEREDDTERTRTPERDVLGL